MLRNSLDLDSVLMNMDPKLNISIYTVKKKEYGSEMLYRYLYNHNVLSLSPKAVFRIRVHIRIQIGLFFPSPDLDPVRNKNPDRIRQIRIHEKTPKKRTETLLKSIINGSVSQNCSTQCTLYITGRFKNMYYLNIFL